MAIIGTPRKFHHKWKYLVDIDGFAYAGFHKCSELSAEVGKVEYREGGALIPHKSPGLVSFADITLERGATKDQDIYEWFQEVAQAASGLGLTAAGFKRNLDIVQQDRDGTTLRRWSVYKAWPVKFVAGEWDSEAEENVIESVTLTYDYFELA